MKLFKNIFRNKKREIAEYQPPKPQPKPINFNIKKMCDEKSKRTFELKKKSLADLGRI